MLITKIENSYEIEKSLLDELLKDRNTNKNIIWGTDNYSSKGFKSTDLIKTSALLSKKRILVKPRVQKNKTEQLKRIKDKAEVFTPSWVCNIQNNLIDNAWFGRSSVFNSETNKGWETNNEKIDFDAFGKHWQDYVKENRLEITCGEAPYLTSRYDTVTGVFIEVKNRIGLLDRKLRVVNENCSTKEEWLKWTKNAYKSIYGYEYQGDSLLIARENLLFSFLDNYFLMFNEMPEDKEILEITIIITWNIFQMDGLKYVVPESCTNVCYETYDLFGEKHIEGKQCAGCKDNNPNEHNGKYVYIMDWEKSRKVKFLSLMKA